MKTLKMQPGLIAVERIGKVKREQVEYFATPEESQSLGIVRYAADDAADLLGKKVLFGTKREEIRAIGKDLVFMEKSNVFAEVEEEAQKVSIDDKEPQSAQ